MAKFQAEIGLNTRQIGANKFVILGNVQALDDVDFDREHCHAELNANVYKFMDRVVKHTKNRQIIEFEADVITYFRPRENRYGQTLTKIRQIKPLGRA